MFTITITPKVGSPRVESFETREEMASMLTTLRRCGISATPSEWVDMVRMGTVKVI